MGATYTRQSTYTDGDTITADHTNDEFDQLLAAFAASTGHTHDGTAGEGGPISTLGGHALTFGSGTAGTDIVVTFDGESNDGVLTWNEDLDYFEFSDDLLIATTEKIQFRDTGLYINSSADGQLDIVADTEVQIAATTIDINGAVDVSGNLSVGGNLDVTGSFDMSDANITNIGSIALDTITNDGTDITLDSSGDIILDAGGANITIKDDGTSILDIANESSDVELTVSTADKNFKIKGTDDSSAITALDIDMALAGKATFNGDVVIGGDLTISGDDLVMGTNTAGHLLIADGTNFNPTAVGSLDEIGTVADTDVFLAVDATDNALKRITRSTLVSGLATSSAISNVVQDTTPQLGGNLDMNGADIVTTSNANLDLAPNGTGKVVVRGNNNSGAITFNCDSNSHGQTIIAQPHTTPTTNTMLLPEGTNSTLVSRISTDTLTNKTLTAPKIADGGFIADANGNELVVFQTTASAVNELEITNNASGSNPIIAATGGDTNIGIALTPKGTGEIVIGASNLNYGGTAITATGADINLIDGITNGTVIASKAIITDSNKDISGGRNITISGELDAATGDFSGAVDVAGALTTAAITASGILKTDDATEATSTTDGSLQTDGGLSVVKDAVFGDDIKLLSDASVIHFGADSEVTLTHTADVGLALKHTATADDKPIVLTLQTGETDMAANDVIGKLAFQAPDEGTGTDAILVAAAVQAVAEADFSSSNNATRLEFHTGASELAAVKMTLNSNGAVKPVTYQETYVSKSAASTVTCNLSTANHFAVTLDQNTTFAFTNPPASGTSFAFTLIVTQHSTAVTLTWPGEVDWAGGSAPDAAGNNEVQAYGFITRDGGTEANGTYYGFLGGTAIA